ILCTGAYLLRYVFFFQAEDGIRDDLVTGVQTCALPISMRDRGGLACACAREDRHGTADGLGRSLLRIVQGGKDVHRAAHLRHPKIGRASCRERGWMWVMAGRL